MVEKGSYTVFYEVKEDFRAEVGSLGEILFKKGFYCYTGSAFGPGGLKRVSRHRKLCQNGEGNTHWHIDYLSVSNNTSFLGSFKAENEDIECVLAESLQGESFESFGCSDCGCESHLFYYKDKKKMLEDVKSSFENIGCDYSLNLLGT